MSRDHLHIASVAAVMAAFLVAPAASQGTTLSVENRTSRTVVGLDVFPLDGAGNVIEDNIGGHRDPVPPGASARFPVSGDCGKVMILVQIEGGAEARPQIDTCSSRSLTLRGR